MSIEYLLHLPDLWQPGEEHQNSASHKVTKTVPDGGEGGRGREGVRDK